MSEKKRKGMLGRHAHKFALTGEALAALSILFLAPFVHRRREQRKARCHGRFAIRGH